MPFGVSGQKFCPESVHHLVVWTSLAADQILLRIKYLQSLSHKIANCLIFWPFPPSLYQQPFWSFLVTERDFENNCGCKFYRDGMCVKYIKGMHYDVGGLVLEMGDCCCVELTGGQWGYSKCLSTLHHSLDGKTREEYSKCLFHPGPWTYNPELIIILMIATFIIEVAPCSDNPAHHHHHHHPHHLHHPAHL